MQRISQSLTSNHALSLLLKMPSIKKKMPSLSTNQRSVILPFIDKHGKQPLILDKISWSEIKSLLNTNWVKTREVTEHWFKDIHFELMRIMSAIISAVFKATIGLIVDKGRDVAAERMKEGDVADQKFRSLIVRDLKEIHNKLDVLSQKDLKSAVDFFETGLACLYKAVDTIPVSYTHLTLPTKRIV